MEPDWKQLREHVTDALRLLRGAGTEPGAQSARDREALDRMQAALECIDSLQAEQAAMSLRNHRLMESIRRGEERYRSLVENLEDVVFSLDQNGRLTYISGAISRYGYAPESLTGAEFSRFVHPEDLPGLLASFAATLAGKREPFEFRVFDAGGQVRYVRTLSRTVATGDSSTETTGVLVDLTQQRSTEQRLRTAHKLEAIGRLAGGIAHDFNNITSVVLSYAGFALDSIPPESEARADLQEVVKAAERASVLTSQLLAFGRRQTLQPREVDLNALVAGFEKMLRRLIGEDLELEVELEPELGSCRVDPGQIEQVLLNLAVNSRDAMPDGGRLLIETRNVEIGEEDEQKGADVHPGRYVEVAVTDTGQGMDESTQQRALEPFFTTKDVGKGTGLGLATAYGIVRQSGGTIHIESAPGRGTTLRVWLPRLEESEEAPAPSSKGGEVPRGNETVLVVEDDENVRNMVQRVLRAQGYKVLTAANGEAAVEEVKRHGGGIELVVADVVMPGMGGLKLADRLEGMHAGWSGRMLYMSGYSMTEQGTLPSDAAFIRKPFTGAALARAVRRSLDRKG